MSNPICIFIPSGAGAPGFAGIIRCLREQISWRIIAGDTNPLAYGQALADVFMQMPASNDESLFIDEVIAVCNKEKVNIVLPITTRELEILAINSDRIQKAGAQLLLSSAQALSIANNKGKLYEFVQKLHLPIPEYRIVSDAAAFEKASIELGIKSRELCFKPVLGNGSRGFGRMVSFQQNQTNWMDQKAGILPLTLGEWLQRLPKHWEMPLLLSRYLPGIEYSVDMLCNQGKTLLCIPRTRDKMIGGISVAGKFEQNFGLIAFCIQLAEALHLHGPIGMQWKEDQQGVPHLLEINPRLQGTTSAVALAGLNIPVLAIQMLLGRPSSQTVSNGVWGKKFVRFWDERLVE
ncbi:MAG: ATP-grasp domain-containing protein [Flavobacteriaceae bacterium]|nr:ATP-grasp domain-containing protein [Flavobacteriaceae bacterium]